VARFDIASMQPLMEGELADRAQITMLAATGHTGDTAESEAVSAAANSALGG
jgi:hypothetical protein